MLGAVAIDHVGGDVVAAAGVEVDVDVGQGVDARRVDEPLEAEATAPGVDVGQAQGIGHHRIRARPAAGVADALAPGEADGVPDDEEVLDEAHLLDDLKLVVEAIAKLGGDGAVALVGAAKGEVAEHGRRRTGGVGVMRDEVGAADLVILAPLGNAAGGVESVGEAAEETRQVGRRLEPPLGVGRTVGVGLIDGDVRADAREHVVHAETRAVGEVDVVRGDGLDPEARGEVGQVADLGEVAGIEIAVKLDEEALGTEN